MDILNIMRVLGTTSSGAFHFLSLFGSHLFFVVVFCLFVFSLSIFELKATTSVLSLIFFNWESLLEIFYKTRTKKTCEHLHA